MQTTARRQNRANLSSPKIVQHHVYNTKKSQLTILNVLSYRVAFMYLFLENCVFYLNPTWISLVIPCQMAECTPTSLWECQLPIDVEC